MWCAEVCCSVLSRVGNICAEVSCGAGSFRVLRCAVPGSGPAEVFLVSADQLLLLLLLADHE